MMTEFQSLELKHKNLLVSYKKVLGLVQKCIEFNETTRKEYEIHLKHFTEQFESNPSGEVNELEQANTKVVDIDIQVKTELNEILETVKAEPEVPLSNQAFDETVKTEERTVETVVSLESLQVEEKVPLTKSQKVRAKKIAAKKLKESAEETLDSTQMKQKLDEVTINSKNKNNTTEMTKVQFRRVKDEEADPVLLAKMGKNSFDNKKGAVGSFGEKADLDLKRKRGKSFVQEKNKKKRGSYRGGKIDSLNSFSIKYDSSD